ncbi:oligosaccharide repeat unit polymerase family protein [Jeotgalibacillus aurantiacus]|uniref:oligosaccharide repeat unit polymerase family protein n=1 Tax=Jeotgalibacillus aurantiacus TaxID=2763266 RepID=UPI001D0B921F|nr:oligosaccharide repeat unit polymerase family protein [Jeotgalibacillus aurantiacus]
MKIRHTLQELNRIDMFSPYLFFPFVIFIYFATSLFDFGRFEYFDLTYSVAPVVLTGFLSYWLMVWIVRSKNWRFTITLPDSLRGKSIPLLFLLAGVGLVAYILLIISGQIGIFDAEVRRNPNPSLQFFSAMLWFAALYLGSWFFLVKNRKIGAFLLLLIILIGLFALIGYITPVIVMLFTAIIVFHYMVRPIEFTWFMTALLIVGLTFSMIGFYQLSTEDPSNPLNSRDLPEVSDELNVDQIEERNALLRAKMEETPDVIRGINYKNVTGHVVLSKLMEYTDQEGYLLGDLHASILGPVLPGEQIMPRKLVAELTNSLSVEEGIYITRPGRTTSPTLFGQFYADFGYVGVILGFGLAGFLITILYNQTRQVGERSYQKIAYAFVLTIFTVSLHTGLLDLGLIFMILFAFVTSTVEKKI